MLYTITYLKAITYYGNHVFADVDTRITSFFTVMHIFSTHHLCLNRLPHRCFDRGTTRNFNAVQVRILDCGTLLLRPSLLVPREVGDEYVGPSPTLKTACILDKSCSVQLFLLVPKRSICTYGRKSLWMPSEQSKIHKMAGSLEIFCSLL